MFRHGHGAGSPSENIKFNMSAALQFISPSLHLVGVALADLIEKRRVWWEKSVLDQLPKTRLVGGISTPLQNMKVSWDYYSQYMEK